MVSRISINGTIAGIAIKGTWSTTGNNVAGAEFAMPAAKTGVLLSHSDANTGVLTMDNGHGLTTGQVVDIYWTIAGVTSYQYGVTLGTVSVNSVPFDLGAGTNLPANTTPMRVMVRHVVPCETCDLADGDANPLLVCISDKNGILRFRTAEDESGTEYLHDLVAGVPFVLFGPMVQTAALGGTPMGVIQSMTVSHGDSASAGTFKWALAFADAA